MDHERLPIREVIRASDSTLSNWPATLGPIAQVLEQGLPLGRATVLVGENGSGKSTLVEAIARAFGLSPEGGSTGARLTTRASESSLWEHLTVVRWPGASRRGYFLRGETAHGLFTYLENNPNPFADRRETAFHEMSHGESFLRLVEEKFRFDGLWVLDEPEAALSYRGCLRLVRALTRSLRETRSQVLLSTHSPILAALPGATILELGDWGLRPTLWSESELVMGWRSFLAHPERHLDDVAPTVTRAPGSPRKWT